MGGRPRAVTLPVYQTIADAIQEDVSNSIPAIGEKLPSEAELAERFQAGRHTIREALRLLREKGLIHSTPGIGTVVVANKPAQTYAQRVGRLSELLRYPEGVRRRHLTSGIVAIDTEHATLLGIEPGSLWFKVSGIRMLENASLPIGYFFIYFAARYGDLAVRSDFDSITIHEEIEKTYGIQIESADVDFLVSRISEDVASQLFCDPQTPSLTTIRRYYAASGEIVQASIGIHPEKRYTYSMDFVKL